MLDFRRANPERQRADPTMAGSMAVTADNRRAGQRKPLLGADNMNDSLFARAGIDITNAEFGCVLFKRSKLLRAFSIRDRNPLALRVESAKALLGGGRSG